MAEMVLTVEGMSCNHCKTAVEKALAKVPGVGGAQVDLAAKKAAVSYDPAVATRELMVRAVEDAGYSVRA